MHEPDKEDITYYNPKRIEYHIVNIGNPERRFCHKSRYKLQKLDTDTEKRTNHGGFFHTETRNKGQSKAKRNHKHNVKKRGFNICRSERGEGYEIHAFRLSVQHKVWHKIL